MQFLADESCDFAVVRALREKGHDVCAVCELTRRSVDREVIELAYRQGRVLLTEDKDFGQLVFASHAASAGVLLIRFPSNARRTLGETVSQLVEERSDQIVGAFVVIEPGHIRIIRKLK